MSAVQYVGVDESVCIGCGSCAEVCPEVFRMTERGTAEAYAAVSPEMVPQVKAAWRVCPLKCILLED